MAPAGLVISGEGGEARLGAISVLKFYFFREDTLVFMKCFEEFQLLKIKSHQGNLNSFKKF
jgi:hypothetical protein